MNSSQKHARSINPELQAGSAWGQRGFCPPGCGCGGRGWWEYMMGARGIGNNRPGVGHWGGQGMGSSVHPSLYCVLCTVYCVFCTVQGDSSDER